ncbi:hypothetical protein HMPREF0277_0652 [Corynebacterium accolens ATCC 49726]|nr:hypothetical protein HMPREF0276_1388 [Corynebacterium accolens ATCC 49725]EFM44284.1 hypothetical protein HMPREF0277_0652 [Corynebacterium accolens ATCC 49726]
MLPFLFAQRLSSYSVAGKHPLVPRWGGLRGTYYLRGRGRKPTFS